MQREEEEEGGGGGGGGPDSGIQTGSCIYVIDMCSNSGSSIALQLV